MLAQRGKQNLTGLAYAAALLFFTAGAGWAAPQVQSTTGPAVPMTPKQRREWLEWNHKRVRRDVRRLVDLWHDVSEHMKKTGSLEPEQQKRLETLRENINALAHEFEKSNPHLLPLGVVTRAETVEEEAKTLINSFAAAGKSGKQLSQLAYLTRQIHERAKSISSRLRNP